MHEDKHIKMEIESESKLESVTRTVKRRQQSNFQSIKCQNDEQFDNALKQERESR